MGFSERLCPSHLAWVASQFEVTEAFRTAESECLHEIWRLLSEGGMNRGY